MKCIRCLVEIPSNRSNYKRVKFCTNDCRYEYEREKLKIINNGNNIRNSIPTGTIGAVHELLVSIDLLNKGYDVFRSISPSSSCDLAILRNNKLIKVEVTTGIYTSSGKLNWPKKCFIKYDLLAVVIRPNKIFYFPELTEILK